MKKFKILMFILIIMMLIAGCSKQQYLIFETNGGNPIEKIAFNDGLKLPLNPVKDGYTFSGWYLDNETFTQPFNQAKIDKSKSDITIYAKWIRNIYKVDFECNGGEKVQTITASSIETAPVTSKTGYSFTGWYDNSSFNGEAIKFPLILKSDMTLYAKWDINSHEVKTLNSNVSAGIISGSISGCDYGSEITLEANPANGYSFGGWYIGNKLLSSDLVYIFRMPDNDLEITAVWSEKNYILTVLNDNLKGCITGGGKYSFNQDVNLTASDSDAYFFGGWYNGQELLSKNPSYTFKMPSNNLELRAEWLCKYIFTESESKLTITGKNAEYNTAEIIIPETIDGKAVTAVSENSFLNLTNITKVSIPRTVTVLHNNSFVNCNSITDLTVPLQFFNSNQTLYNNALKNLTLLCNNDINNFIADGNNEDYFILPFKDTLENITLGEGITRIGNYAFYGCLKLKSVSVPDSVLSIGYNAFEDCYLLKTVSISSKSSLTEISDNAFSYCMALESINIPDAVETIPVNCFYYNSNLKTVQISSLSNLKYIEDSSFSYCVNLENINLPNGLIRIGNYAFTDNDKLTTLDLGEKNSLVFIGFSAFESCEGLLNVILPENINTINNDTFRDCINLAAVTLLSANLELIDNYAFYGCKKLISVNISSLSVPFTGNGIFIYTGDIIIENLKIKVVPSLLNTYKTDTKWSLYTNNIFAAA